MPRPRVSDLSAPVSTSRSTNPIPALPASLGVAGHTDPVSIPQLLDGPPRRGALGKALQRVGQLLALALDVEYIAVAGRLTPGCPLPGAQALRGISDGVIPNAFCINATVRRFGSRLRGQVGLHRWWGRI